MSDSEALALAKKKQGQPVWSEQEDDLIRRVSDFCRQAHGPQVRKYTNAPYFLHCFAVASLVFDYGYNYTKAEVNMIAAAFLHDTVEDTSTEFADIYEQFGQDIGDLVFWLTDISRPEMGNRALRKHLDRLLLWSGPA